MCDTVSMNNPYNQQSQKVTGVETDDEVCASSQSNCGEGSEETTQNLSDLELAYKDQGYHEMEFTSGDEYELHKRKKQCRKNPGHLDFIPAKEFVIEHLTERYRDSRLFDLITSLIRLTVRLAVAYTSKDRPPNYPLYNRRGQSGVTAFGSGMVWHVCRKFAKKNDMSCPCKACKESPLQAKTQWGEFKVATACHVIFDESEARHAKCNLFFDSDTDRYTCPSLESVRLKESEIVTDHTDIICITHDEDVSKKLEEMLSHYYAVRDDLWSNFKQSPQPGKKEIAVVISHPHGLSKYVTVSEVTDRRDRQDEYPGYKWKYSAETCPGSSGGPVFLLGTSGDLFGPFDATHSGYRQKGHNESIVF